ncbi:MAG TPA: hypothetical protein VI728_05085 [Syntrophales bacterium]|nr:hypothetical protein [Syntrophales bacterium]
MNIRKNLEREELARPLRLEFEGTFYHVTARGNERKNVYFGQADYLKFLEYLREAKKKYGIFIHGYMLKGELSPAWIVNCPMSRADALAFCVWPLSVFFNGDSIVRHTTPQLLHRL